MRDGGNAALAADMQVFLVHANDTSTLICAKDEKRWIQIVMILIVIESYQEMHDIIKLVMTCLALCFDCSRLAS